jgi:ribosomal-protein-alanine N-acetyltransferase
LKLPPLQIDSIVTDRLMLIPFTIQICKNVINNNFSDLNKKGFKKGKSWPDEDVLETLPRIIKNLSKVKSPTGFESWMIIKKDTLEIIGNAGFKGFNYLQKNADIGYGIIKEERRKGYAEEAVLELIKWAFSTVPIREITAACLLDNANSINLLKKISFTEIRRDEKMIYWSIQNTHSRK